MTKTDYRHAGAAENTDALDSAAGVSTDDLRVALANALERIASLEKDREGLGEPFKAFNEQIEAAQRHGPGVLREQ